MMILSVYTAKLSAEGMGRMDAIEQKILQVIDAHAEEIKAFGRDIFHHAELGYQEHRTAGAASAGDAAAGGACRYRGQKRAVRYQRSKTPGGSYGRVGCAADF